MQTIVGNQWRTTAAPTQTERDGYRMASAAFGKLLVDLEKLVEVDLEGFEKKLERAGAP